MIEKIWNFIKENVAVIITVMTALITVVYSVLRLCIYVYWNGYFRRLNIDIGLMNLNFDKSIFEIAFIVIVLFIVLFFIAWAYDTVMTVTNKGKKRCLKGRKKILSLIKDWVKAIALCSIILTIINIPLIILLVAVLQINFFIIDAIVLFSVLYSLEMMFIFFEIFTNSKKERKEEKTKREIVYKLIEALAVIIIILVALYYNGTFSIDKMNKVRLIKNEEYMITYCDGEYYVLHKVKCEDNRITLYRNEQKIVCIENYEYYIKKTDKIIVSDE